MSWVCVEGSGDAEGLCPATAAAPKSLGLQHRMEATGPYVGFANTWAEACLTGRAPASIL